MDHWYEDWFNTSYYQQLYACRDDREAAAFIDQLIQYLQPAPGSRMLDVACGRGRHSIQLAEKGFDVTGIDLSTHSIDLALPFERENLHFFVHDMRRSFFINYFQYAFNFFTSFGYFRTQREHDDSIRTIAQSLRPHGIFVLDYLNVHYTEDQLQPDMHKEIDGVQYQIRKWHDDKHFFKQITVADKRQGRSAEFIEKVAKFSLGDFTDMLAYQGMQVKEVFGDYHFSRYDIRQSPRLILMAEKIK